MPSCIIDDNAQFFAFLSQLLYEFEKLFAVDFLTCLDDDVVFEKCAEGAYFLMRIVDDFFGGL